MKNSNDTIGNRTPNLPTCSAVNAVQVKCINLPTESSECYSALYSSIQDRQFFEWPTTASFLKARLHRGNKIFTLRVESQPAVPEYT
jgi:hypothetical protein